MKIIYNDGSELEAYVITISDGKILADDIYEVDVDDVLRIEEG